MEKKINETNQKNQHLPERKIRAGAVTATIWQNDHEKADGKTTSYSTVSLERVYKDKEGNWKSTNSFRASDLPKLTLVAQKAYEYVLFKTSTDEA